MDDDIMPRSAREAMPNPHKNKRLLKPICKNVGCETGGMERRDRVTLWHFDKISDDVAGSEGSVYRQL
jgi:hypothetical protein